MRLKKVKLLNIDKSRSVPWFIQKQQPKTLSPRSEKQTEKSPIRSKLMFGYFSYSQIYGCMK